MVTHMMMERMMMSVGDVYRQFIPDEHGEPLEEQIFPWSVEGIQQKKQQRLDPEQMDPMTISRILQMKAVEMQHWTEYLAHAKMITDERLKKLLNSVAWAEHMHYLKLLSLLPVPKSPSQAVLKGEISLIHGYDMCLQNEPNDSIRSAFQHIQHDHKQHAEFAAQQLHSQGMDVQKSTGGIDISGGRPLEQQFMKPDDCIWQGQFDGVYKKDSVDPQTLVNVDMSLAGEMAAWTTYGCASLFEHDDGITTHFAAFSSVENQHVSILSSIKDPTETILERALVHEQVEMQNYHKMMEQESHPEVREVFEHLYREDMEQARRLGELA